MSALSATRWLALSPWLDEALELEHDARAAWLDRVRERNAAVAADLARMLHEHDAAQADGFLSGRAAPPDLPNSAARAGVQIGPYVLETLLGRGGMGSVWSARRSDGRYDAQVAVKLLHAALITDGGERRFKREGQILARLEHPHIARLLDAGVAPEGQPYLVLEHVRGEPLDTYCDAQGLGVASRIALFLDVLAAVAHAHAKLVVHRDLKPSNVLVGAGGEVKLLDFGIAKLIEDDTLADAASTAITREGGIAMTPAYAAPEQLQGEPVSTATDVYALGVLLYALLTGRHPTAGDSRTPAEAMRAVLEYTPIKASASVRGEDASADAQALARARASTPERLARRLAGDLDNIVAKALKKDPRERYASVAAFGDDLRRHLEHRPVAARADSWRYRCAKLLRRHRAVVAVGAFALLAVIAGVAGTVSQALRAAHERDQAHRQLVQAEAVEEFMTFLITNNADKPLTSTELLERGAELAERQFANDPGPRSRLQMALSGLYSEADALGKTAELLAKARAGAQQAGDVELLAQIECAESSEPTFEPDSARAALRFERALKSLQADAAPNDSIVAYCRHLRAIRAFDQGDITLALADERRALELLGTPRPGLRTLQIAMRQTLSGALAKSGDIRGAIEQSRRAVDDIQAMGRGRTQGGQTVLNNLGVLYVHAGDSLGAIARFDEALDVTRELPGGVLGAPATLSGNRAQQLLEVGREGEAVEALDKALAAAAERGDTRSPPFIQIGFPWCAPGELARCEQRVDAARESLRPLLPPGHATFGIADLSAGRMALAAGEPQRAKERLERALAYYEHNSATPARRIRALTLLARAEGRLGHGDAALALAERAEREARRHFGTLAHSEWLGSALLAKGVALKERGDERASAVLRDALAQLEPSVGDAARSTLEAKALLLQR